MTDEYGEFIGVDSLYYALVTADTAVAYTVGTPAVLAPVAEIAGAPVVNSKTTYYNNQPRNTFITEGETPVKLIVSNIPAKLYAILTGKYYDEASGRVYDSGKPNPPDCAVGFRYDMGADGHRYYWYLKGKFSPGSEDAKSKETDVDVKTYELTFTGVTTTHEWTVNSESKSLKRVFGDTAEAAFDPDGWFDQVQTPDTTSAPAAIALSTIVPADGNATAAIDTTVVLTFNNEIVSDEVILIDSTTGDAVAVTKAYDVTGKILTLTPSAALTNSTKYIVSVAGVVDIYGQELAAVGKDFTTIVA